MISYDTRAVWIVDALALVGLVSAIWIGYDAVTFTDAVAPLARLAGLNVPGLHHVLGKYSGVIFQLGTFLIPLMWPFIRIIVGETFTD